MPDDRIDCRHAAPGKWVVLVDGAINHSFISAPSLLNAYSRRHKNGDVSVPFHSVQTETVSVSVQFETVNGIQ